MRFPNGKVRKYRKSIDELGHAHELTFSCHKGFPFLAKDRTRRWFVDALDRTRRAGHFELWAYVIMPEHAHVLLLPVSLECGISTILKSIKQSVSRRAIRYLGANAPAWLQRLKVTWPTGRTEHRFWQQGGGYDRNFDNADAAWASVEYIHRNPVRRGLVECPTDWAWSSARWYEGLDGVVIEMDGGPPPEGVR